MKNSSMISIDRSSPVPLYYQIKESVKKDILSGALRIGDQVPSEREICERYGVSRITAIRAMSDLVEEGFLRREHGKGTFVADPRLRSEKTFTLGIGLYDTHYMYSPFFSMIISGITEVAVADDFRVELVITKGAEADTGDSLYDRVLQHRKIDGLAIIDHAITDAELIGLHSYGIPIVLFDRVVPGQEFCSVLVDNRGGVFQVVEYLNGLGHRHIGFVTHELGLAPFRERYEGYRSALDILGLEFRPEWVLQYSTLDDTFESSLTDFVGKPFHPTALVCAEDYAAIRTSDLLRKLGYSVPRDYSVVGFDNIPQSAYSVPPITTIDSGLVDIGREMARMLLSQIQGQPIPSTKRLSRAQLIVRESTDVAPDML